MWRIREITKYHADDEHTTLEAIEVWNGDDLVCGDVDTEEHARLIEAAPDLLAIAERILDRGYVSESIEEERDDHLALVAAIAKAKGRS